MKRVIVTGGRDYGMLHPRRVMDHPRRRRERALLREYMDKLFAEIGPFQLVHGGASGADILCNDWCLQLKCMPKPEVFQALWEDVTVPGAVVKYRGDGRPYNVVAGFQRNQLMADKGADLCIAFSGGKGTADMVRRATAAKIEVREAKQ